MTPPAPFPVEHALKRLGDHIRIARLRRNLSMQELGDKAGLHRRMVAKIECGAPKVSIGAYMSLLWAMGILDHMLDVASPETDSEGKQLAIANMRKRARHSSSLDNDF